MPIQLTEKDVARFLSKYNIQPITNCWEYLCHLNNKGYGNFKIRGVPFLAHRVSYTIHKGPIPEGMNVLHTCDNPACVNPEHLWIGSFRDNSMDMVSKNRQGHIPSEECHTVKLTSDAVIQIRELYGTGRFTQRFLAILFDVSQANISKIVRSNSWNRL